MTKKDYSHHINKNGTIIFKKYLLNINKKFIENYADYINPDGTVVYSFNLDDRSIVTEVTKPMFLTCDKFEFPILVTNFDRYDSKRDFTSNGNHFIVTYYYSQIRYFTPSELKKEILRFEGKKDLYYCPKRGVIKKTKNMENCKLITSFELLKRF